MSKVDILMFTMVISNEMVGTGENRSWVIKFFTTEMCLTLVSLVITQSHPLSRSIE